MTTTEPRTAAANRARMRASEEKAAERLRDRGWICLPPGSELVISGVARKDEA